MMYPYYYAYAGFGFLSFLWHLILFIIFVWIIVLILRALFGHPRRSNRRWRHMNWHAYPALEILDERFAKGEISKEEYEERKKVLMSE